MGVAKMAKLFRITPTSLNTMITCPRQFEAKYITREVKFQQTEATIFGTLVHESIEAHLRHGTPLVPEAEFCAPFVEWVKRLAAAPGAELLIEHKMGNAAPWDPNNPHAPRSWKDAGYGGIADVVVIDHAAKRVFIIDWKTGKKAKDDPTQAHILAMCAASQPGWYRDVTTHWVFVKPQQVVSHRFNMQTLHPVHATEVALWNWRDAVVKNEFQPTPNGLCKQWCDVVSCPFNGRRT